MLAFFLFVLGTAIGSFLTVAIDRIPRNISIITGRSVCESCKHTLSWIDLVPVISYILLRGRCRYCKQQFGPHYLLLEILTGVLFVTTYLVTVAQNCPNGQICADLLPTILYRLVIACCLFVIFFIDLRHSIIPFSVLIVAALAAIIYTLVSNPFFLTVSLLTAVGSFLFFLVIHLVTKGRGMGFGDVLFAFVIGLILGFPTSVVAFYIAFLTGSVISLILVLGKKKHIKSAIPFGPFLVVGTFTCLLWGPELTHVFLAWLRLI